MYYKSTHSPLKGQKASHDSHGPYLITITTRCSNKKPSNGESEKSEVRNILEKSNNNVSFYFTTNAKPFFVFSAP